METLPWVGPTYSHIHSCKRETKRDLTQKRKRQYDHRGRDYSDVSTSQGMFAATRGWKRQGTDSFLETPKGVRPY